MKKLVLCFVIFTIFSACNKNISSKTPPKVINGTLDLRNWDFARDGIIKLDGEWKFYWQKLYFPDQLKNNDLDKLSALIKVPLSWNGQKVHGNLLGSYGYATYSLKILLNESQKTLFFKFPTAGSAFNFYANGERILSAGKVGTSERDMVGGYAPQIVNYTTNNNELDIVVHVSNFNQKFGGLWYSINLGTLKEICKLKENKVFLEIFMFGIFIIMGLYYLGILAMRKEEKLPLFFTLFCFFLAIRILFVGEFLILNLFPDLSIASIKRGQYLSYFLAVPSLGFFLDRSFPKEIHRIVTIIVAIITVAFSGIVIFTQSRFFTFLISYFQLFTVLLMFYYVYAFVLAIKRKRIGGIILSIGAFSFFLASINDILYMREIINTFHTYHFGLLMFIFSQSLLMSKRFSNAFQTVERLSSDLEIKNKELSDLNLHLEEKVKERTEELEAANQEMHVMNEDLIRTRDNLWGEMKLAKKIQTVLLPETPAIDGYEILGHMTPADDVGGDYYDIINCGGYDWVVIGDVSGHGMPAGLIMMMVQTAINAYLDKHPDHDPSQVLSSVNKTIRKNLAKLDEEKYMTITLFAILKDGKFVYSGLHQDIFIYRKETGQVDIVETEGFWLGILDDVESCFNNNKLNMTSGDIMLLYTDGITEAWLKESSSQKNGSEEEMYGNAKLLEVFKQSAPSKSLQEINDNLLKSLEEYEYSDDITFLLLRKV